MQQRGLAFMRYLLLVSIGISPPIWRISMVRPDSLMLDELAAPAAALRHVALRASAARNHV
jgi:hypothetical protein